MTETIMAETSAPGLTLSVNGAPMAVPQGSTVLDLLALCGLPAQKIALERNLEIVPRSAYGSTLLEAGDAIEIVHFIGGG